MHQSSILQGTAGLISKPSQTAASGHTPEPPALAKTCDKCELQVVIQLNLFSQLNFCARALEERVFICRLDL
jgi:hypothetical protein